MLISVDSGDPAEIQQVMDWGFPVDKITSNPTTISATIRKMREHGKMLSVWDVVMRIRDIVGRDVPVSVETIGTDNYRAESVNAETFVKEALIINEWDKNFVVKLPTIPEGLAAARSLIGMKTNFTLIFSEHQARLAAVYGGAYASPFVGRIDDKLVGTDIEREGMDLVKEITEHYAKHGFATAVLTASTRKEKDAYHLQKAAEHGSHVVTVPFSLFEHILNTRGAEGIELVKNLRDAKAFSPAKPAKPTYDEVFQWGKLRQFETELVLSGVQRFLADAQSAGYSILEERVSVARSIY